MLSRQTRSSRDRANIDLTALERYSDCVEEQAHILDNKLDYHALLTGLGWMSIKCLTVRDVLDDYDQSPIGRTEHSWYDETCNLQFPTLIPSSWDDYQSPLGWMIKLPLS